MIAALSTVIVSILSVSTSQVWSTDVHGGPGGDVFAYECADNGYLVGVEAKAGSWIDSVQAACAWYDPKTATMVNRHVEGPVFGGAGGAPQSNVAAVKCGPEDVIDGYAIRENAGERYIGYLSLICVNGKTGQRPATINNQVPRVLIQGSGNFRYTDSGTPLNDVCGPGRAAIGFRGRAGSYLDAFGLICAPLGWPRAPQFSVRVNGPGDVTFINPVINAPSSEVLALDSCLYWGKSCGQKAAERYCRQIKLRHTETYKYAVSFVLGPRGAKTYVPYSKQICDRPDCVAFSEIRCANKDPGPPPSKTGGGAVGDVGGVAPIPKDAPFGDRPVLPAPSGPDGGVKVGNGWKEITHVLAADFTADGKTDLIARMPDGEARLFPFDGTSFYTGGGPITAGTSWNFANYWSANWSGDKRADILARTAAGDAFLYEMQSNNTTFGGGPKAVGAGWNHIANFHGDFDGDGSRDMVGVMQNGDAMLVPTYALLLPGKVGSALFYTHYLVGDFTGDGRDDLVGRTIRGDMMLHQFGQNGFEPGVRVGNGWNFSHYFAGDFTGDGKADLLVRGLNGDMLVYPFKTSFYDGGQPIPAATNWQFQDYYVADFSGDGVPDVVARTYSGDLIYFPWKGFSY